jgi:hypothetical protein
MRLTTIQILLLFSAIILTTSCSGQSLSGRWKLKQVDLMDVPNQTKKFTIDLSKPDKMKALLYEANIPEENIKVDSLSLDNDEDNSIDTSLDVDEMKADIDKYVASAINTSMMLKSDNKFYMRSNGLIVPTAVPGWHFGDTLQGRWTKVKDTLVLSIGDDKQGYKWKFKVLQVTSRDLKLQEVFDGFEGRGNELRFVRQ